MSVVHFLLLTLFFLNFYTSLLITLSCRYVKADDPEEFEYIISKLSQKASYMKTNFHPNGNMVCLEGKYGKKKDAYNMFI